MLVHTYIYTARVHKRRGAQTPHFKKKKTFANETEARLNIHVSVSQDIHTYIHIYTHTHTYTARVHKKRGAKTPLFENFCQRDRGPT